MAALSFTVMPHSVLIFFMAMPVLHYRLLTSTTLSNSMIMLLILPPLMAFPFIFTCQTLFIHYIGVGFSLLETLRFLEFGALSRLETVQWSVLDYAEFLISTETRAMQARKKELRKEEERARASLGRRRRFTVRPVSPQERTLWYYLKMFTYLVVVYGMYLVALAYLQKHRFRGEKFEPFVDFTNPSAVANVVVVGVIIYSMLEIVYNVVFHLFAEVFQTDFIPLMHRPYISLSLQDFWSRKWNMQVKNSLQKMVFMPTFTLLASLSRPMPAPLAKAANTTNNRKHKPTTTASPSEQDYLAAALRKPPAAAIGISVFATFLVSGLFHEYVLLMIGRNEPSRLENVMFFSIQGVLCIAQEVLQRRTGFGRTWGVGGVWNVVGWTGFVLCLVVPAPLFVRPYFARDIFVTMMIPHPPAVVEAIKQFLP